MSAPSLAVGLLLALAGCTQERPKPIEPICPNGIVEGNTRNESPEGLAVRREIERVNGCD